ncbi:hypothetical protein OTU49_015540 [Cherax quadricarinatus]|uniref:Uncharacterized protein n=1 Tax=Cherax quadricarinatus TaxID=27406 RepID=A0AAW0YG74_CHEQU
MTSKIEGPRMLQLLTVAMVLAAVPVLTAPGAARSQHQVQDILGNLIRVPFLPCIRKCEVRLPNGSCRLDIPCVDRNIMISRIIVPPCYGRCVVSIYNGNCAIDYNCLRQV